MAKEKSELRVVAVQVKDVLGAREFGLEPGKITVLSGANGTGKSTALAAIQAALGGGVSLAKLARIDPKKGRAEDPEVVLVLGGEGNEEYRVTRKGDKVSAKARVGDTAAFEDVPKPQAWLSSLFDPQGANPVRFLQAPDKDRALMLLEALPLKFDRAALLDEMGIGEKELPPIPRGLHPLEETALIRDAVFGTRTGVNRDQKAKAQAAQQVRQNAPAVVPDDHAGEVAQLRQQRDELTAQLAAGRERARAEEGEAIAAARHAHQQAEAAVSAAFKAEAQKLRAAHEQRSAEIRAEAERRIAALAAELEAVVEGLRERDEHVLEEADSTRDAALEEGRAARAKADQVLAAGDAALQVVTSRLAELEARAEGAAKARALHQQAKQFDEEAVQLQAESERLTSALAALDAFRRRMAQDLPIPGLEIDGKEIRVNNIPFDQLNTAQRVEVAVKVACLRAKGSRLPVVFVDGAETLDGEHFRLLKEALLREGVQAFLARVTDDPFTVATEDAPTEAGAW